MPFLSRHRGFVVGVVHDLIGRESEELSEEIERASSEGIENMGDVKDSGDLWHAGHRAMDGFREANGSWNDDG